MKRSVFSVVDPHPGEPTRNAERQKEVVRLAEAADSAGLSALWVAEHHFGDTGLCPSPAVLLAACGARTRRIRLGPLVSVLPFHDPVELAEEYALLDRLLDGRLNFGVGSGYVATELDGFGIDLTSKRERFDRALATIRSAWAGEEVRVDRPGSHPVRLNVRPLQLPHPPITVAVQRREAIRHVAEHGFSIALIPYATVKDRAELAEEIAEFRRAAPAGSTAQVAVAMHTYIGADVRRAREALQRYLDSRLASASTFYQHKVADDPHAAHASAIESSGLALFGSAEEFRREAAALEAIGVDELLAIVEFGDLPFRLTVESVRALGAAASEASDPHGSM
ncbi:MAG: LLM class flavin-dependent oxidoreductase [Thermoplasmata archaeon]